MDTIVKLAIDYVMAHQQYFLGIATGYAVANIPKCVLLVFKFAMRVPWIRAAVVSNPAQAKAIVDSIRDELDKDIDAEAAAPAPTKPAP